MTPFLRDFLITMGGYTLAITFGFWLGNFLSRGLAWLVWRVWSTARKGSVLVFVQSLTIPYFAIGKISGEFLKYRPRGAKKGEEKLISLSRDPTQKSPIQRRFGIPYVETDEVTNNLYCADFSVISGFDAQKFNSLVERIAMLPKRQDKKTLLLLIVAFAILAVCLYTAYQTGHLGSMIASLNTVKASVVGVSP